MTAIRPSAPLSRAHAQRDTGLINHPQQSVFNL